jgi:hypothetical protein
VPLLRHVAADGIGDADAAEQQRAEAHQADELGEALDLAADRGRRIGPVGDGEAAFGELGLDGEPRAVELRPVVAALSGKLQAIDPADQAPGLDETGAVKRVERHQDARTIGEAIGQPVRLGAKNAADGHGGIPDRDGAADPDIEALEQRALSHDDARFPPDRAGIARLGDDDLAVERVGAVDGFHFDQRALASGDARHGAQARRFRHLA